MMHRADPAGHALELARSATPGTARRTAVAGPAAEVVGLLLVKVLRSPRGRAAVLRLARSLTRRLASRRLSASTGVEVTARQVTVVQEHESSVLVHRAETALIVRTPERCGSGPQTVSTARDIKRQPR